MLDYKEKPEGYFSHARNEIVMAVPVGKHRVLEVGCGEGATGAALKIAGRADWVVGVELIELSASRAKSVLDQVICGSIEQIDLPFEEAKFDVIILADVLEHLVDPWTTLSRLTTYLKSDGLLVLSLPNVRNWRVLSSLLIHGKWEYQDEGIMDRTHLRFFSKSDMVTLVEGVGFNVEKISPTGNKSKMLSKVGLSFFSDVTAVQYVLVCHRCRIHPD